MFPRLLMLTSLVVASIVGATAYGMQAGMARQAPHRLSSHGATERVSVSSDGSQTLVASDYPSMSADGNFVAFTSASSDLVAQDTNNANDIFVHNRETGETERVSVASGGAQGNGDSRIAFPGVIISASGRFVTFTSLASNLVPGDTNGVQDVFVHDRQSGQTERVSVASDGAQGNDDSYGPTISADGRFVAFISEATTLVTDDTNGVRDIFVHDRQTGQTERVSVASDGAQANGASSVMSLSEDGRFVGFWSAASNLVAGDTNNTQDVFVHDRETGTTTRVSVSSGGMQANGFSDGGRLSADGRYVAFISFASNLVAGDTNGHYDVFVHDRESGETERVSVASDGTQGNRDSKVMFPTMSISADGLIVAFVSLASNLVPNDTNSDGPFIFADVFIHDRSTGETERVSVATDGSEADGGSEHTSISADGRYIAFDSLAGNLVDGDTNEARDIFVHDREGGPIEIYLPFTIRP